MQDKKDWYKRIDFINSMYTLNYMFENAHHPQYTFPPWMSNEKMEHYLRYSQPGDQKLVERIGSILRWEVIDPQETADIRLKEIVQRADAYPRIGVVIEVTDNKVFVNERRFGDPGKTVSWRYARKHEQFRIRQIHNETVVLEVIGNPHIYLTIDYHYLRGNYKVVRN